MTATDSFAVFRLDGRPESGLGHLSRCAALAAELREAGWRVAAALGAENPPIAPHAFAECVTLSDAARADALQMQWPDGCDLLVVDHYDLNGEFESDCRDWARCILAMDDGTGRHHDCDLLLDAAAQGMGESYRPFVPAECEILAGPSFALLPDETRQARSAALARDRSAMPRRATIYLGGAEDGRLTLRVVEALAAIDPALELDIVLPSAAARSQVATRLATRSAAARVHDAAPSLAPLFGAADFAVGAAGVTAWERCCLGLPSLAIVTAENQRGVGAHLRATGAATVIERAEAEDPAVLIATLTALLSDGNARQAMARAAADLCDGEGPRRVAEAIAHIFAEPRRTGAGRC